MRNTLAYPLSAALLIFGGCSKLETPTPDKTEESCDLCHTAPLSQSAVHRMHLSNPAMANFPYHDDSPEANYAVLKTPDDSTIAFMVDTAFSFSRSATRDAAIRYQQNRVLNEDLKCTDCHHGLDGSLTQNNDANHRNGRKDATFNQAALLAKHYNPNGVDTAHYNASAPGDMSFDGTSCSNILCHGAGRKSLQNVTWNTSPSLNDTLSCLLCHNTSNHKVGVACDKCHYDVTLDGGQTIHNFRKHLNDTINYGRY